MELKGPLQPSRRQACSHNRTSKIGQQTHIDELLDPFRCASPFLPHFFNALNLIL